MVATLRCLSCSIDPSISKLHPRSLSASLNSLGSHMNHPEWIVTHTHLPQTCSRSSKHAAIAVGNTSFSNSSTGINVSGNRLPCWKLKWSRHLHLPWLSHGH